MLSAFKTLLAVVLVALLAVSAHGRELQTFGLLYKHHKKEHKPYKFDLHKKFHHLFKYHKHEKYEHKKYEHKKHEHKKHEHKKHEHKKEHDKYPHY